MPGSILRLMIKSPTSQQPLLHARLPMLHHHQGGGGLFTDAQQTDKGGILTSLKKYHVIMMVSFISRGYLDSSVKIFQHVLPLMFILHPWNHLKRSAMIF